MAQAAHGQLDAGQRGVPRLNPFNTAPQTSRTVSMQGHAALIREEK
jgi:hypothetical protein